MEYLGGTKQVLEAVTRLDTMVRQGAGPKDVAAEAELIVAGWWWNGCGHPDPGGLGREVGELRRWCAIAAAEYATGWDRLSRAGLVRDAERARDGAVAFDHAWTALAPLAIGDARAGAGREHGDGLRLQAGMVAG